MSNLLLIDEVKSDMTKCYYCKRPCRVPYLHAKCACKWAHMCANNIVLCSYPGCDASHMITTDTHRHYPYCVDHARFNVEIMDLRCNDQMIRYKSMVTTLNNQEQRIEHLEEELDDRRPRSRPPVDIRLRSRSRSRKRRKASRQSRIEDMFSDMIEDYIKYAKK